ncbi:hypothetical protein [Acidithiobacillus sp. AMEEHan]|uniref:hypothetical protein n=1 Tax=Acidithiobacillus sp. AMEEHan TaxID=2994951 RepID=UPI0027E47E7F|nr:hypothetical protein [Acidithiobacillus sp. AMEEHan]
MALQYVTISTAEDQAHVKDHDWQKLTINGKGVGFLQKPLLDRFEGSAKTLQGTDQTQWRLTFFSGTEYETRFLVSFSNSEQKKSGDVVALSIWQTCSNSGPTDEQSSLASKWLRGSATLTIESHEKLGDGLWLAVDGAALSVVCQHQHRFERFVILLALACAYQQRIQALIVKMAEWDGLPKELSRLIRLSAEFNARHYFRYPVLMDRKELPLVWDLIAERMRLAQINQEFLDQLQALHKLVAANERDKETRRWQWVGAGFGFLSAIQVLNLLPEGIRLHWFHAILAILGVTP